MQNTKIRNWIEVEGGRGKILGAFFQKSALSGQYRTLPKMPIIFPVWFIYIRKSYDKKQIR